MNRLRLLVVALVVLLGAALAARLGLFKLHDRAQLVLFIEQLRAARGARWIFVATYALATAIAIPATPFTLAGGALFGIAWGSALNWCGAMLGASAAFAVSRAFGDRAAGWLARHPDPRFAALSGPEGGWLLFRLRVIPVVPFALLNVAAGLIRMTWNRYLIATAIGILPVIAVYTTFAANLMSGASGAGRRALLTALAAGIAIVALSLAPRLFNHRAPR